MTRTGLSPRLARHAPSPQLSMHPDDAQRLGLDEGTFARIVSAHGEAILPVTLSDGQRRGEAFAPIHWNDETAGGARVGALVHAVRDPVSGQPDNKATPVRIETVEVETVGFMASRSRMPIPDCLSWSWAAVENGFTASLASSRECAELCEAIASAVAGEDRVAYADAASGVTRLAVLRNDQLEAVIFLKQASNPEPLPDGRMIARFWAAGELTALDRLMLLSGQGMDAGGMSAPPSAPASP